MMVLIRKTTIHEKYFSVKGKSRLNKVFYCMAGALYLGHK